jgi:DNA-directed RNA polymerase specialized sigma24 family protein
LSAAFISTTEAGGAARDYDAQQPFTPWAYRFAINIVKQWVRSRERWQSLLDRGLAEELANRREQLRPQFENRLSHLDQCLEKLPSEQRGPGPAISFLGAKFLAPGRQVTPPST